MVPFNLVEHVDNAVVSSIVGNKLILMLCINFENKPMIDFFTCFVSDKCDSPIEEEKQCERRELIAAKKICMKLATDSIFRHCLNVIPLNYLTLHL